MASPSTAAESGAAQPRTLSARSSVHIQTLGFSLAVIALLGIALALRLVNISNPPGFDEGKYSQGLVNMSRGFRPFAEIFNPQGPLFYPVLFPFFRMGGETLEAARLGSIFMSMMGLGAVGATGWLVAGRAGALISLGLLTVSPQYLAQSRVIQSEAAALGFALPAVALAAAGYRAAEQSSVRATALFVMASALLALSFAVKALTLGSVAVLLLAVLASRGLTVPRRLFILGLMGFIGLTVLLTCSLPFDLERVWQQGVVYHHELKRMQGPDLAANWFRVTREIGEDGWGLLVTALLGGIVWMRASPRVGLVLIGWLCLTLVVLMTHSPLLNHHMVVLVPPLVLLSAGLARAYPALGRGSRLAIAVACLCYAAAFPTPFQFVQRITEKQAPHELLKDAGTQIGAVLAPEDFLVTDHPYAATLARRATPPELADADKYRFESGWITSADLIRISQERDVKAALLWLGIHEQQAPEFVSWVQEQYFPLWSSERPGQVLYVRKDIGTIDVSKLPGFMATSGSGFGADLELIGFAHSQQALAGTNLDIRMIWHATAAPIGDYRVVAVIVNEQEESIADATVAEQWQVGALIGDPGQTTSRWSAGDIGGARLRLAIPANAALGRNRVFLGLQRPDGSLAPSQAVESDGKPRRSWNGMMFLTDLNVVARG